MLDIVSMLFTLLRTYIPAEIRWSYVLDLYDMFAWNICMSVLLYCVFFALWCAISNCCCGPCRATRTYSASASRQHDKHKQALAVKTKGYVSKWLKSSKEAAIQEAVLHRCAEGLCARFAHILHLKAGYWNHGGCMLWQALCASDTRFSDCKSRCP